MNKIVQLGLVIVGASLLGACCNTAPVTHCGSATDTFCMKMGAGDRGPGVKNWQCFLLAKGFGQGVKTNGVFDSATEDATRDFQHLSCYEKAGGTDCTGTVNFATYAKAVRAGMPKYKLVRHSECSQSKTHAGGVHATFAVGTFGQPIGNLTDVIYTPMSFGCKDKTTTTPPDPEVSDWQAMLRVLGYKKRGAPGSFDLDLQNTTGDFQAAAAALNLFTGNVTMGVVDADQTFRVAKDLCVGQGHDVYVQTHSGGCNN